MEPGVALVQPGPTADYLQHQDAEGVHVGLAGEVGVRAALVIDVSPGAHGVHIREGGLAGVDGAGEAKVAEAGVEDGVEHDVGGREVAVHHHPAYSL